MKDNEVLVKVEGLSKKFCKDLKTSLWYGLKDLVSNIKGNKGERKLRSKEFWAVKDISFELRRGECLGLIGHNGAGKSTLLKILNGLINPDAGKVIMKGRVGALIELGAGFNPILSGRENIYNNGAVLGFTRKEIDDKVEDIIDFAEIREFIDMPVQNYSSGMKVRLGFAVAAQMEPDVLIIDEVLAVGDVRFKTKCFNAIEELTKKCAVIIVSHSMPQIARICTELILMNKGEIEVYEKQNLGPAIEGYYGIVGNNKTAEIGSGVVKIENILINRQSGKTFETNYNEPLSVIVQLSGNANIERVSIRLTFFDVEEKPVAQISSKNDQFDILSSDNFEVKIDLEHFFLNIGTYNLHLAVHEINDLNKEGEVLHIIRSVARIEVKGNSYYAHAPCLMKAEWSQ
ncbi:ABC transporter ATP-binding protein [Hyunsoonleella rubra]|uniref:ABC transporter ATP-binding protein n=1 Tax=Hyunsoonleella rubra TaxID=1737062 RepID=A0ABW5TED2_9FLAO